MWAPGVTGHVGTRSDWACGHHVVPTVMHMRGTAMSWMTRSRNFVSPPVGRTCGSIIKIFRNWILNLQSFQSLHAWMSTTPVQTPPDRMGNMSLQPGNCTKLMKPCMCGSDISCRAGITPGHGLTLAPYTGVWTHTRRLHR
ncbi:hypothetical protein H6P81_009538 [Aristolochia fimbriata]|uniref:Uncharacterized protein n=1 Tax=Aristolochia fimbriata TaxID=158543 RepID=A0AAV7EL71_ARIFI|nr:hypothetical protein H6P81_009538 [Aristolochia fimbriata]